MAVELNFSNVKDSDGFDFSDYDVKIVVYGDDKTELGSVSSSPWTVTVDPSLSSSDLYIVARITGTDSNYYVGDAKATSGDLINGTIDDVSYSGNCWVLTNWDTDLSSISFSGNCSTDAPPSTTQYSIANPIVTDSSGKNVTNVSWNVTFPLTVTEGISETIILSCNDGYKFSNPSTIAFTMSSSFGSEITGFTMTATESAVTFTGSPSGDVEEFTVTKVDVVKSEGGGGTSDNAPTFVTAYLPSDADIKALQNAIWMSTNGDVANVYAYVVRYHQIFDTLTADAVQDMKLGNYSLSRNVGYLKSNTYIKDMGSVKIDEHFKSADDYKSTTIKLYIPLYGYIDLSPSDVMGHTIYLQYNYEIMDGKALAIVYSDFIDPKTVVTQVSCNFAIEEPIGSNVTSYYANSYWQILTAQLGELKPYILISRKTPASDIINEQGQRIQKKVKVSDCSGYTKFDTIFINNISATSDEKNKIINYLKSGVLVN